MSEVRGKDEDDVNHLARKACSKDHGHAVKNSPVKESPTLDRKRPGHSGIKFIIPKNKVTVPKPFSFDVGPRQKKVSCTSPEKSALKHTHVEKVQGTEKHVKITTEHVKVSRETLKSSSTRSKEGPQKIPANDVASPKKHCTRHLKAKKSEDQPSEKVKSPAVTRKSVVSNVTKSVEKPCTKTKAQLLYEKNTKGKSSPVDKADGKDSGAKPCPKAGKRKPESSNEIKPESVAPNAVSSNVKENPLPNGIGPRSEDTINEENESNPVKGSNFWPEPDLSNGGTSIKEINLEYEISKAFEHTTIESVVTKSVSKIPRKNLPRHSGLKFCTSDILKKSAIPQPVIFDHGNSNGQKENVNQVNNVEIANMAIN